MEAMQGTALLGGQKVVTEGISSTNSVAASYPGATVRVFNFGTTNLATIFADNLGTPLSNPFTSSLVTGDFLFYAANGRYAVQLSGAGMPSTETITDVLLNDPTSSTTVTAVAFISASANPATSGVLRLASADFGPAWASNLGGPDIAFTKNASDIVDLSSGFTIHGTFSTSGNPITGAAISGTTGTFSGAITGTGYAGGPVSGTTGTFSGAVTGASYSGGPISGTTGTFTGNVSGQAISGTTGTFSGAITGAGYSGGPISGTTGTFSGAVSTGNLSAIAGAFSGNVTVTGTITAGALTVTGAFSAGSFSNNLSAFAATTSAQLAGVISDETGSGPLVFANSSVIAPTSVTTGQVIQPAATALTIKDNQGGTRFSIPAGGVAASTLNNTNITGASTLTSVAVNTGIPQGSGLKHQRFGGLCSTAAAAGATCITALTWTSAFADANYTVTCSGHTQSNTAAGPTIESVTAAGFTVRITAITAAAATFSTVDCIAIHD